MYVVFFFSFVDLSNINEQQLIKNIKQQIMSAKSRVKTQRANKRKKAQNIN